MNQLAFINFGSLGAFEIIVIGVVALLLFGSRLPEVGRSLGRGIVEFKKGLSGIESDVENAGKEPHKLDAKAEGSSTQTTTTEKQSNPTSESA